MKRYLKSFMPDFRPTKGPDASFDLRDFLDEDFTCPLTSDDMGIYIITSTDGQNFTYPVGESPVIYIGMSDNLLRRLRDEHFTKHLKVLLDDNDWGIEEGYQMTSKYQYMLYHGSHVDVLKCLGNQESKELESYALQRFYQKYRSIPVGNGARSFSQK